jgi:hypothetical protein
VWIAICCGGLQYAMVLMGARLFIYFAHYAT